MTDQQRGFVRGSGVPHRGPAASDELWAEVWEVACPYCQAPAGVKCHSKLVGDKVMPAPHWHRIQAAERQAS